MEGTPPSSYQVHAPPLRFVATPNAQALASLAKAEGAAGKENAAWAGVQGRGKAAQAKVPEPLRMRINAAQAGPSKAGGRSYLSTLAEENLNLRMQLDQLQKANAAKEHSAGNADAGPSEASAIVAATPQHDTKDVKEAVRLLATPPLRVPVTDENAPVQPIGILVESSEESGASPLKSVDELKEAVASLRKRMQEREESPAASTSDNVPVEGALVEGVGETASPAPLPPPIDEDDVDEEEEEEELPLSEEAAASAVRAPKAAADDPLERVRQAELDELAPNATQNAIDRAAELAAAAAASDAAAKKRIELLEKKVAELTASLKPARADADAAREVIQQLQGRIDLLTRLETKKRPEKLPDRVKTTFAEQHVAALELAMSETREELRREKELRERERARADTMLRSLRDESDVLLSTKQELEDRISKERAAAEDAAGRYDVEARRRSEVERREEELAVHVRRLERKLRRSAGDDVVNWAMRPATRTPNGHVVETPMSSAVTTCMTPLKEASDKQEASSAEPSADLLREGAQIAIAEVSKGTMSVGPANEASAMTVTNASAVSGSRLTASVNTGAGSTTTGAPSATTATGISTLVTATASTCSQLTAVSAQNAVRWASGLADFAKEQSGRAREVAKIAGKHVVMGAQQLAGAAQMTHERLRQVAEQAPAATERAKSVVAAISFAALVKFIDGKRKQRMRRRKRAQVLAWRAKAAASAPPAPAPPPPPPPPTPPPAPVHKAA